MVLEIHNQGQIPLETGDYRKYVEEERRWCSKEVREEYGVSVWKAIKSERKVFNSRTGIKMGNNRKFWKDK
ncbi:hypothetical protein CK203_026642 [Vitis vinifera]|uniref:Uncharacterized protein n=1 Tax=Vitis vinifera TaxID=29760 RepID=A0A438IV02_VITVI|nr:hypothetical protein CK203_079181 [Vitis vinifera]RVX00275.1 hypothetical protein CK203_026642 [Vitis vinifera]